MEQVARQQINALNGGIAFCSKNNAQDVIHKQARTASALLVPNGDPEFYRRLVPCPVVKGPHEIVVQGDLAGTIYKRQVLVLQLFDTVNFAPPKPTYSATLAEVAELVLELDTRLMTKEAQQNISSKPHGAFKQRLADQLPNQGTESINLYGHRTVKASDDHQIRQIIVQGPQIISSCLSRGFRSKRSSSEILYLAVAHSWM